MPDRLTAHLSRCPTCQGQGRIRTQRGVMLECPTCRDVGVAAWWAGRWWTWLQPLHGWAMSERRLERLITALVTVILFVIAVGGLVIGGWRLEPAFERGLGLSVLFERSWPLTAWWVGLLTAMYLWYRFQRQVTALPIIPPATTETAPPDAPWGQLKSFGDLSRYFPEETHRLIDQAWWLAKNTSRETLAPLHLLAVLSAEPRVATILVRAGINPTDLQRRAVDVAGRLPTSRGESVLSAATQELLDRAFLIAAEARQTRVGPPHLMAAIAQLDDPARELLFDLGLDEDKLQHVIAWMLIQEDLRSRVRRYRQRAAMRPRGVIDRGYTAIATPILDRFSTDLTNLARLGKLPYVVGRDDELQRVIRIIEGGQRSVVLVGDSGVGKTTVLYGLAERMVAEDVPEMLQDKRLVSLSGAAVVAGAGAVGELEGRLQSLLDEVVRSGNIVLVVENLDQLVGVSSTGGGGLDLAQIIAQALETHAFIAIATAETVNYRRTVEFGALASILEKVEVAEMTPEQAIVAAESVIGGIEHRHDVYFSYDAVAQAVNLTHRYMHDKTLPGKALEVLEEAGTQVRKSRGPRSLVSGQDVAAIVTERTKITVTAVSGREQQKLLNLEAELHRRVIGQDEAVKAVADALRRARAELRDTKRPIANLLFLGPTGVGKTELAKSVAAVYFGSEEAMIRLDMSEYQEVSSINRLIGAPPGFSGSGVGGYLTEAVRANPFSLVLLDELEKAHPDILNLFLQVMDDGRLTDGTGRTVDFTNIILIATSNAGTQLIQNRMRTGATLGAIKEELMNTELQQHFRPEFLNRFDAIIVFTPLDPVMVRQIVGLMIGRLADQLALKGIQLRASDEAVAELAAQGFDPLFGARPLRRAVQEKVDNALAKFLLEGRLGRRDVAVLEPGGTIRVEQATKL